jgi:hypothetical protein
MSLLFYMHLRRLASYLTDFSSPWAEIASASQGLASENIIVPFIFPI